MPGIHDIRGYSVVLDKVCYVTRVFDAPEDEGMQFNIKLTGDALLRLRFPDRATATLERDRLVEAIRNA